VFKIEQTKKRTEEKLGNLYWDLIQKTETEIQTASVISKMDSLLNKICLKNSIQHDNIKLHILKKDEVNAFALPNNYLIVYSGLIDEELCGVLCHEIAHIQKRHIMKKLGKEVGLGVLVSMTSANGNAEIAKRSLKILSSTAYDRNLESEADITAADYLVNADINPESFANFLLRLANDERNIPKQLYWVSTHPDAEKRSLNIIQYIKNKRINKTSILSIEQWNSFKKEVKEFK
jgi:predicted Zn-dependent protease